jgi:hypothetical protein
VPPPPVSGADVGKLGLTALDVCVDVAVAAGVDGSSVVTPGLAETEFVARAESDAEADADGDVEADVEARAELDVDAPSRLADAEAEALPGDCEADALDVPVPELVFGVGVKVGVAVPPEQAETAIATRTAPAAERPAISHAPWVAPGLVRRIFTNLLLECVSDKFAFSASTLLTLDALRSSGTATC